MNTTRREGRKISSLSNIGRGTRKLPTIKKAESPAGKGEGGGQGEPLREGATGWERVFPSNEKKKKKKKRSSMGKDSFFRARTKTDMTME